MIKDLHILKEFFLATIAACVIFCNTGLAQSKKNDLPNHTIVFRDDVGWHKISEIMINAESDSNAVPVRGLHKYREFRLFATDGPVHIEGIKIFYENGAIKDTTLNMDLKAGETSKQFRIDNSSTIRGIEYRCHSKATGKKPHLLLYGFI